MDEAVGEHLRHSTTRLKRKSATVEWKEERNEDEKKIKEEDADVDLDI